jgi:hypothetical protein
MKSKEKAYARVRRWQAKNPEKVRAIGRKWRAANPERVAASTRKSRGLPEPARPRPTTCECCGKPPGKRKLHLDHCHLTGVFRGWLCQYCNTGIGALSDNVGGLHLAIAYLERAYAS